MDTRRKHSMGRFGAKLNQHFPRMYPDTISRTQFYVGHMYESPARTEADLVGAYKWYSVATEQGMPLGRAVFELLEQRMPGEEVYEAEQSARQFRPKAE